MHIIMTGKWVCSVEISEWLIVEITPCKSIQFKIQRILFEWKPYAQWVAIAFISFDLIVGILAGYCFPQTWRMHAKRKSTSFLHSIILLVFISRRDICLHIFIRMTILLLTQTWICTIFFFFGFVEQLNSIEDLIAHLFLNDVHIWVMCYFDSETIFTRVTLAFIHSFKISECGTFLFPSDTTPHQLTMLDSLILSSLYKKHI